MAKPHFFEDVVASDSWSLPEINCKKGLLKDSRTAAFNSPMLDLEDIDKVLERPLGIDRLRLKFGRSKCLLS